MPAVHREVIDHHAAWTAAGLGGKEALILDIQADQLDAIDALLEGTLHLAPQQIRRADFDHPAINRLMDRVREVLLHGRGCLILGGLAAERYGEEELRRIYWGLGTHLGTAAVQSVHGDRLGRVETADEDPTKRGYRSLQELNMHSDSYEIVGLMSVRAAKAGGISGLVSSLALHNEMLRTRPDLLAPLYEGFWYASEEAQFDARPVTEVKVPVFSCVDGLVSCHFEIGQLRAAAKRLGVSFSSSFEEATQYFRTLSVREDLALSFLLEPGEILLFHNFTHLHSRTAFENYPERKRLLLRLWLTPPHGRPCDPAMFARAATYERLYRESPSYA
jgi:hypothetical protein